MCLSNCDSALLFTVSYLIIHTFTVKESSIESMVLCALATRLYTHIIYLNKYKGINIHMESTVFITLPVLEPLEYEQKNKGSLFTQQGAFIIGSDT